MLYTVTGGITAVIWTDVVQMLVMFIGMVAAIAVLFWELPSEVSFEDVIYIGGIRQMWKSIDLSWDPTNTYTLWSGLIGGLFLSLAYFGCDQSQVQRYLTARSLKQSRFALIFNGFVKVPMQFFILTIGVLLFVFYHFERPPLLFNPVAVTDLKESSRVAEFELLETNHERLHKLRKEATLALLRARKEENDVRYWQEKVQQYDQNLTNIREESKELARQVRGSLSKDVNYVLPTYLIGYVPAGILGLMIAVIFAAAMSSLDSELAALSSTTVIDFYKRYWRPNLAEERYLVVSRLVTLFWGLLATLVALYAGQLEYTLIEAINLVGSYFYGSLLGVFLLAFLDKKANGTGAFWGLIGGLGSVFLISYTNISWLYYNLVGAFSVVVIGFLLSRLSNRSL